MTKMLAAMTAEERSAYMSELGKKGFRALAMKLGDNGAAVSFLQKKRGMPKLPRSEWSHNKCWNVG